MSQREIDRVNKVYRTVIFSFAAIMAIGALIYNHAHLITASMIYIFGATSEFKKRK